MNIIPFSEYKDYSIIDIDNKRINKYITLINVKIVGRNNIYPNCLLLSNNKLISPYDEKIMSFNKEIFYDNNIYNISTNNIIKNKYINYPVYFFIYNFDNYYHFIYDTLSYLCCYFKLKMLMPDLKLVVSYPNITRNSFYKFNEEIFDIFGISKDIIIHNKKNIYQTMYIGSSLTHGGLSNESPHQDVYKLFKNIIIEKVSDNLPKKIYISRRTWVHNDKSNIGTDYTQRRLMVNEDNLVEELVNKYGFTEIFCENLSMVEKIQLFQQAEYIIGAIGGGMCNLLFSPPQTKVICIVSPYFLDINHRFRFSMDHTNIYYIHDTHIVSKLYIRVKIINKYSEYYNKIGEIIEILKDSNYNVQMSNNDIAGFNNSINFDKVKFNISEIEFLDNGLNSPYIVDINSVINIL